MHLHKHGQQQHARGGGQTRPRSHNLRDDDLVLHGVQGGVEQDARRQSVGTGSTLEVEGCEGGYEGAGVEGVAPAGTQ